MSGLFVKLARTKLTVFLKENKFTTSANIKKFLKSDEIFNQINDYKHFKQHVLSMISDTLFKFTHWVLYHKFLTTLRWLLFCSFGEFKCFLLSRRTAIPWKTEKVRFYLHCSGCNNYHKKWKWFQNFLQGTKRADDHISF